MDSRNRILQIVGLALLVAAVLTVGCFVSYRMGRKHPKIVTKVDTVISVRIDTITLEKPVYLTEIVVDSVEVPVIRTDTVFVQLPITQRWYHQDSVYDAWVSGYRPQLDSINVMQKTRTVEITRTVEVERSRWGVGVTAGFGAGTQGLSPFIGVGVTYNIWQF